MNKNNLTCIIDDNYYNTNEILDIENYKTFVIEIRHATSVYNIPEGKDGDVITVRNTCEDYVDNPLGDNEYKCIVKYNEDEDSYSQMIFTHDERCYQLLYNKRWIKKLLHYYPNIDNSMSYDTILNTRLNVDDYSYFKFDINWNNIEFHLPKGKKDDIITLSAYHKKHILYTDDDDIIECNIPILFNTHINTKCTFIVLDREDSWAKLLYDDDKWNILDYNYCTHN